MNEDLPDRAYVTVGGSDSARRSRWSVKPYVVIGVVFWLLPALLLGILWLVADQDFSRRCDGGGWSCGPPSKGTIVIIAYLLGLPFAGLGVLAMGVTAAVQYLRGRLIRR